MLSSYPGVHKQPDPSFGNLILSSKVVDDFQLKNLIQSHAHVSPSPDLFHNLIGRNGGPMKATHVQQRRPLLTHTRATRPPHPPVSPL